MFTKLTLSQELLQGPRVRVFWAGLLLPKCNLMSGILPWMDRLHSQHDKKRNDINALMAMYERVR